MGLSGPYFKLIYHAKMVYKSWIDSSFTLMHEGIFGNYVRLHKE